jgi:hypothetical protein
MEYSEYRGDSTVPVPKQQHTTTNNNNNKNQYNQSCFSLASPWRELVVMRCVIHLSVGMRTLGQPPGVGGVTTAEQTRANPGRKKKLVSRPAVATFRLFPRNIPWSKNCPDGVTKNNQGTY